ncbi:MAG: DUF4831 family protein [Bacteroidales bacterium]
MRMLIRNLIVAALLFLGIAPLLSQTKGRDGVKEAGTVQYTLPITVLHLEVETKFEEYKAGPYAKFASKYLGIDVATEDRVEYTIESVELIPYIEADPTINIFINLGTKKISAANFLELTNQGLVMWSDSYTGKSTKVRYPTMASNDLFVEALVTPGITHEESTLYKGVRGSSGIERATIKQSQIVEKGVEKRAEEAASHIFHLRTKKIEIITGDTDATFSGDALRAAIEELNRLEEEYLSLFIGKKSGGTRRVAFDVVPTASNERQIYVAFRMSESGGALPAENLSGRPIVLELSGNIGEIENFQLLQQPPKESIIYRRPISFNVKLTDGQERLLESRVPIYQLGKSLSFPLEIMVGKFK